MAEFVIGYVVECFMEVVSIRGTAQLSGGVWLHVLE